MSARNTYYQEEVVEKQKIDLKNLKRLLRYAIPYKRLFIVVLLFMLVAVAASLVTPLLLQYIVNTVIPEFDNDYKQFAVAIGCFVIAGAAEIFITFYQQRSMGRMGHGIIADIRHDIFYKLQVLPFDYFDNRPAGKIGSTTMLSYSAETQVPCQQKRREPTRRLPS